MSAPGPGYAKQLWYKWKALRLPWRSQHLVGADLAGNTFWEFKDALNSNRWRRIVKYSRAVSYSDVKITPQWHQWLRHTRLDPPSIQEQQYDVSRQAMMKQLATKADERWKSLPSFRDPPKLQQPEPGTIPKDPGGYAPQTEPEERQGVMNAVEGPVKVQQVAVEGEDAKEVDEGRFKGSSREKTPLTRDRTPKPRDPAPWQQQQPKKGVAGEDWQPESWVPGVAPRR